MIAALMLSLTVFGVLVAAAAWMADRACMRLALPRRWTWLAAMLAMGAAPLLPDGVVTRVPVEATSVGAASPTPAPTVLPADERGDGAAAWWPPYASTAAFFGTLPLQAVLGAATGITRSVAAFRALDVTLLSVWVLASAMLLVLTGAGARRLSRERRRWMLRQRESFASPAVWVSDDVGPAAFGASRGEIVIPRWAMSLPPLDRRLLLLHERSHVEARDPRLLAIGLALVILLPWHLPLRWAFRRLQRAIEQDCDRRVLHKPQLARRYAELLLSVAERGIAAPGWSQHALSRVGGSVATMTSLAASESALAARIRNLAVAPVTWRARAHAISGLTMAVMLVMVACTVPIPQEFAPVPASVEYEMVVASMSRDADWSKRQCATCTVMRPLDVHAVARDDSLVMDAIVRTRPELVKLAATETPFVAVALTDRNEVVAHSIRAGAPPRMADSVLTDARFVDAANAAGVQVSEYSEAMYAARLAAIANEPKLYLDSLGISHLLVNARPLTVLWMRFKDRAAD